MKGFVVYSTYRITEDAPKINLFGRLENGDSFQSIHDFKPYFFIEKNNATKAKEVKTDFTFVVTESDFTTFKNSEASKVALDNPKNVPALRKLFEEKEIECFEADIRFSQRFLIDNDIKGTLEIIGDFSKGDRVSRIYHNPKICGSEYKPELKVLSLDIETDPKANSIYMLSIKCGEFSETLAVYDTKIDGVSCFSDEKSLLSHFKKKIIEIDPDIITGWNVVDFDLMILKKKFEEHKIPFDIARDDSRMNIKATDSFFRSSSVELPGRIVLDGIALLKSSFIKIDDYKLDTAARVFLGESKLIDFHSVDKVKEIERLYRNEPGKLAAYNLIDAELVLKILDSKKLIDLTVQRTILTGMQLDMVKASIASLDSLYIREARKRKIVCPTARFNEREERIKGGYVRDSIPGIYDFVCILDFKSLYPSIIRTFNIDPISFVPKEIAGNYDKNDLIEAQNGAFFKKTDGILPLLIQRLWEQRDAAKKKKNITESNAIKITMNSFFGVLANPICRFYSLDMANAITSTGRFIVKQTEEIVEQEFKLRNIYSDTDSIFIETSKKSIEEAEITGKEIAAYVNKYYSEYISKKTGRESFLELQFEKIFLRFLMPKIRGSETGAKKRYAGLVIKDGKEQIVFTGLEVVRRDWTEIAKKYQTELFYRVFHKEELEQYTKQFVEDIKNGKYDNLIVYKKSLRKNLEYYTKTTPPHVKAARKLEKVTSSIISYVMTSDGPEPIENRTHEIDYSHYIEKQIKPIADSVLVFFNKSFDDIINGSSQKTLLGF
ncbi:MAG: DNA polymerase II [archaeon]